MGLAGTRAAGSQLGATTAYELLLIDWNLPDGSGLDVLASYRAAGHPHQAVPRAKLVTNAWDDHHEPESTPSTFTSATCGRN